LDAIVAEVFNRADTPTVLAQLDAAKIANARLNSVADLSQHPFLRTSQAWIGDTEIDMAALPVRTDDDSVQKVPDLGANGASIRAEFADLT
jgi:formyl-CoA transferase